MASDENFSEDEDTRKLRKEVNRQRSTIHRERQKRDGIIPDDFSGLDI